MDERHGAIASCTPFDGLRELLEAPLVEETRLGALGFM